MMRVVAVDCRLIAHVGRERRGDVRPWSRFSFEGRDRSSKSKVPAKAGGGGGGLGSFVSEFCSDAAADAAEGFFPCRRRRSLGRIYLSQVWSGSFLRRLCHGDECQQLIFVIVRGLILERKPSYWKCSS